MRYHILLATVLSCIPAFCNAEEDWARSFQLPEGEKRIELFNGKDLTGWEGETKYFEVKDGTIRGANANRVPTSTYLYTTDSYRDFRLLLEVKQTRGEGYSRMHSAVAALGEVVTEGENKYGFRGPLLMFCHDWGIYGADGRGRVVPAGHKGNVHNPPYENVGQWNQLEILVLGNRIRMASNGQLVFDYTEQPSRLKICPIGLQLHSNSEPQEWHFRGLILVDSPRDELLTFSDAVDAPSGVSSPAR